MSKKVSAKSATAKVVAVSPVPFDQVPVTVSAKNKEQKELLQSISQNDITFVKGAPGTGKSHIAVAYGLQALLHGDFEQLILTRPVVEACGEKLGFLPGTMYDKIDPYMMPIMEILNKLIPAPVLAKLMHKNGNGNGNNGNGNNGNGSLYSVIRIIPLAYMRGLTMYNSFVIADEIQNSTPTQMRMLLTRLGEKSKMVLCGDIYQTDIHATNGLADAFELLQNISGVGFVTLTQDSIMRHPVIKEVEQRYMERQKKQAEEKAKEVTKETVKEKPSKKIV